MNDNNSLLSQHFPECFHRVSVKGLYVVDNKLLLGKESPALSGCWELPGGGLDLGESPQRGVMREIHEEMGLKVSKIDDHPLYAWTERFENRRGMEWFYSLVLCYRIELEHLNFQASEECEAIDFFSKEQLQSLDLHHQSMELRTIFNPMDFC